MSHFRFEARDAGTHFYHSHAGLQEANGIYGSIIVRKRNEKNLYDHDLRDFSLIVSDWMHDQAEQFFPGLPSRLSLYKSILINGRGRYFDVRSNRFVPLMIYY